MVNPRTRGSERERKRERERERGGKDSTCTCMYACMVMMQWLCISNERGSKQHILCMCY